MASKVRSVRLPEELWEQAVQAAEQRSVSLNAFVQEAIEAHLSPEPAPSAPRSAARGPVAPAVGTANLAERPFRPLSKADQAKGKRS